MATTKTTTAKVERVEASSFRELVDAAAGYGLHLSAAHRDARVLLLVKVPAGLNLRLTTRRGVLVHSELVVVA
jgi:hypothetical protein